MPLLKPVLGRVLPLMGAVKLDNVQWVFANGECLVQILCTLRIVGGL